MENLKRVLVIEDDASMRALISLTLREAGYDVVETSGSGTPEIGATNVRLIVMDINQPKAMQVERIARIRALYSGVPIIAISGYFPTQVNTTDVFAAQLGVDRALAKPFRQEALRELADALTTLSVGQSRIR